MSIEGNVLSATTAPIDGFWLVVKVGVIILAVLYFIFSLVVVRQVHLMTEVLITEISPLIRAFATLHAGLALGIIILFICYLFA